MLLLWLLQCLVNCMSAGSDLSKYLLMHVIAKLSAHNVELVVLHVIWLCANLQDELSGADIKAVCTEAGLLALRERRMRVTHVDFKKAKEKVLYKKKEGVPEGLYM